jgi:hypothetical protein
MPNEVFLIISVKKKDGMGEPMVPGSLSISRGDDLLYLSFFV